METRQLVVLTVASVVVLSSSVAGVALAATDVTLAVSGGNPNGTGGDGDAKIRVAFNATGSEKADLQRKYGVRHDFGDTFTTEIPQQAYERLQTRGVDVRPVGIAYPVHHQCGHTGGPNRGGGGDSCPSVTWINPTDGSTVAGTETLGISASDSDGAVQRVTWSLDGVKQGEATDGDGDGVYTAEWVTTDATEGSHELTATVTDDASNTKSATITVTVDNQKDPTSDSPRVADQTPYGIELVYGDSAITSTSGGTGIDVAVLDTGVDTDHPDLVNRLAGCVDFTGGGPMGTNIDEGSCEDTDGHGTHTAGTVLADGGSDGLGIYGVAPGARLHAYKVCGGNGCYYDDIAAAIQYAADPEREHNIEIVSMSLGGDTNSALLRDTFRANPQFLFVVAAGNDGPDIESIDSPAKYKEAVAVAAVDETLYVPEFSSRGREVSDLESEPAPGDYSFIEERNRFVDVAAPGVGVLSTYNDGSYRKLSGTSMATPHVSGLAAKVWASGVADTNGDGDGITTAREVRHYIWARAASNDVTKGTHAGTDYDPASGIGMPTVVN